VLQKEDLLKYQNFHYYKVASLVALPISVTPLNKKGDKIFDNIVVIPHIDFNTNSGWLHKSRTGLTKLRRRRVKRNLRIKNSSNDSHTINNDDTSNNNDDNDDNSNNNDYSNNNYK